MKIELGQQFTVVDPSMDCSSNFFRALANRAFARAARQHNVIFSDIEYSQEGDNAVATAYVVGTDAVMAVPVEDIDGRSDV